MPNSPDPERRANKEQSKVEKGLFEDLNNIKTEIDQLPNRYPPKGGTFGRSTGMAKQQIQIILQNIGDAIKALESGRDPNGNPITPVQVGQGLKRLIQATRKPGFNSLLLPILSLDRGVPELTKSMNKLEKIADRIERSKGAEKHRAESTSKQKPNRKALLDKGKAHKEQGQFREAIECFDQIIESDQDPNGWVQYLKGTSLMELCSYEEAVACFEAALNLDPEGDTYRFDLGRALNELGRREEARAAFQALAEHSNVYGLDKKGRDWLEKLDLEEGKSEKKPKKEDEAARAMSMIPFVNPSTDTIHTALMKGADSGVTEAVHLLLKAGANPRFKAPTGWTALLLAASKGHADIVQALLEQGADPNDQNVFAAQTPLILAAMGGHEEVVKVLLDAGVNVHRKNQWGRTALSHAMPETEIWKMLVEAGAEE